jgi:hypothetical protein
MIRFYISNLCSFIEICNQNNSQNIAYFNVLPSNQMQQQILLNIKNCSRKKSN